ncbi:MAG: DUF3644 domain-containing protein [Dehalococcoidia bacterium]|nr:DUF3644 domain-containing protein [Dehalococcoidia bacterium]MYA53543.1 DUF3644 domain-containing protein [Dehalococcoidia bacterium]
MTSAIELYNKPSFPYRAESFAILAINAWELLLKAKWLVVHDGALRSLHVYEYRRKADGTPGKKAYVKRTRTGDPFTHGLDFLAKGLLEEGHLAPEVEQNILALTELRDSATHFYLPSEVFKARLYGLAAAAVKNFSATSREWFLHDFSDVDVQLMPLALVDIPASFETLVPKSGEENFLRFLESLEKTAPDRDSAYAVTWDVKFQLTKGRSEGAVPARITTDPDASPLRLTEENVRERYPWDYSELTRRCRDRYTDFKVNREYHEIRKALHKDPRFGTMRYLDPGNPRSAKKPYFNPNILQELDKIYTKR